jgi:hypothetical protein
VIETNESGWLENNNDFQFYGYTQKLTLPKQKEFQALRIKADLPPIF